MCITYVCNLKCKHCLLRKFSPKPLFMDKNIFVNVVKDYLEHIDGSVILTGGEPTLHPYFLEFMKLLKSYNARVGVSTNGLNPHPIIESWYDNVTVQISIDGDEKAHDFIRGRGTYRKVIKTIELLNKHGIPIVIKCTLHRDNFHVINHILSFIRKYENIISVSFNAYVPVGCPQLKPLTKEQFSKLATISNILGIIFPPNYMYGKCYAGELFIHVTPDGLYLDCPYMQNVLGAYPEPVHKLYKSIPEGREPPCLKTYLKLLTNQQK